MRFRSRRASYITHKNHIYTNFNTLGNPLDPLHLALPIFTPFLSSEICRIKNKLKSGAKQLL